MLFNLKIPSFDKMFSHSEILFSAFFHAQDSKMKSLSCFHSEVMVYRLVVVVVVLVFFSDEVLLFMIETN